MSFKVYEFNYAGGSTPGARRSVLVSSDNETAHRIDGWDNVRDEWRRFDTSLMSNKKVYNVEVIETKDEKSAQKVQSLGYGYSRYGHSVVTSKREMNLAKVSYHGYNTDGAKGYTRIEVNGKLFEIPMSAGSYYYVYPGKGSEKGDLKTTIAALHAELNK